MTGFETYKLYLSITRHFRSDSYDFFKYHGKINVKRSTYENRKDRYFFEKLSKLYNKEEIIGMMLSHFSLENGYLWVGDLLSADLDISYLKWSKRIQSMTFEFKEDVLKIKDTNISFNELFVCTDNQHPPILKLLMSGTISIETFIIIDKLVHFTKRFDGALATDFCWELISKRIKKYKPFLQVDNLNKYSKIILENLSK